MQELDDKIIGGIHDYLFQHQDAKGTTLPNSPLLISLDHCFFWMKSRLFVSLPNIAGIFIFFK